MFNKYNLFIALILICSFIFGYKGDDISSGLKKIFSKKEEVKIETQIPAEVKNESVVVKEGEPLVNPSPVSASVFPVQQNPDTLGKTLDSISAGTIPEEQIRKHQEYLKNITNKLKDFQGGEANIPAETPSPVLTPSQNPGSNPPPVITPIPPLAPGFEQQTPINPVEEVTKETEDLEETDDAEDPDEADDTEIDESEDEDEEEEDAAVN